MLVIYLVFIYSLEEDKKYILETAMLPRKRINLSKKTIRVTKKTDIEQDPNEKIDNVDLIKISEDSYYIKLGNSYLMKNTLGDSVIVGNSTSKNVIWTIEEQPNEIYFVKMSGKCLQVMGEDKKSKGNYLHVKKCDGSNIQKFKFIEVPVVDVNADKLSSVNKASLEKEEMNAPIDVNKSNNDKEIPIVDPKIDELSFVEEKPIEKIESDLPGIVSKPLNDVKDSIIDTDLKKSLPIEEKSIEKKEIITPIEVSDSFNDSNVPIKNVRGVSDSKSYENIDIGNKIGERMKQKLIINSEGKFSEIMHSRLSDLD